MPESLPNQEPDWSGASCRQMPVETAREYFFEEGHESAKTKLAQRICGNCVELRTCRDYALDNHETFGVWGGLTPNDRWRIWMTGDAS